MVFRHIRPRYPVSQLREEMDRLLTGFLGNAVTGSLTGRTQPAVNIWERDDALIVELEVPGIKSDQVEISVVDNTLSIKIERPDVGQEGVTYHRRERSVGTFNRVLRLPAEVDADRVSAELRNGVLAIELPKAENARPRKIQVTAVG